MFMIESDAHNDTQCPRDAGIFTATRISQLEGAYNILASMCTWRYGGLRDMGAAVNLHGGTLNPVMTR